MGDLKTQKEANRIQKDKAKRHSFLASWLIKKVKIKLTDQIIITLNSIIKAKKKKEKKESSPLLLVFLICELSYKLSLRQV